MGSRGVRKFHILQATVAPPRIRLIFFCRFESLVLHRNPSRLRNSYARDQARVSKLKSHLQHRPNLKLHRIQYGASPKSLRAPSQGLRPCRELGRYTDVSLAVAVCIFVPTKDWTCVELHPFLSNRQTTALEGELKRGSSDRVKQRTQSAVNHLDVNNIVLPE